MLRAPVCRLLLPTYGIALITGPVAVVSPTQTAPALSFLEQRLGQESSCKMKTEEY